MLSNSRNTQYINEICKWVHAEVMGSNNNNNNAVQISWTKCAISVKRSVIYLLNFHLSKINIIIEIIYELPNILC